MYFPWFKIPENAVLEELLLPNSFLIYRCIFVDTKLLCEVLIQQEVWRDHYVTCLST